MGYAIEKHHGRYNRSTRTQKVKYIVVHYVGSGTSKKGNARNNCIYFSGGNRGASAHYFIDDGSIYEYADPKEYYTWHCGDGHGKYGITNANSVGIEVCQDGDRPFTQSEISRLAWLVKKLMNDFGVSADHVVRHYDASRKECPYYYAKRSAKWAELKKTITGSQTATQTNSTSAGTSNAKPSAKPSQSAAASQKAAFPLPSGHWFGRPSQDARNHSGYYDASERPHVKRIQKVVGCDVDGYFGADTQKCVKKWQKSHGLTADGLVGVKTWTKMFG